MSTVRFIGCLHFSHHWMAIHRGFRDIYEHDERIIDGWNSVTNKRDLTFILGDVTMESKEPYYLLDRLYGRKICVLGNHDRHQDVKELLNYVETVAGCVDYKGYILSHIPIHPNEISFCRGNIHAHIHENLLEECIVNDKYGDTKTKSPTLSKYFNVDAQRIGYRPITLDEITKALGQENWEKPKRSNITWEL